MQLRQHMSFLIDNLYSYLQVDVLESQWTKFQDKLAKSRDFEEVRLMHDQYLVSILQQCFLSMPDILQSIQNVLLMCKMLCELFKAMDNQTM
mmetsp:Transcript_26903/g.19355  ORF Transcript_26903/g.19355 Transcript_26903/m.19355 type:complete len:92 (+) Transcript_26903:298-573(+)